MGVDLVQVIWFAASRPFSWRCPFGRPQGRPPHDAGPDSAILAARCVVVCVGGGVGPPLFQRQQLYQTLHTWRIYILLSPKMTWGSFLKELRFAIQG